MMIVRGVVAGFAILLILLGVLWIGQGLGIIMWPSSSFMLGERQWAVNGAIVSAAGLLALILLRRFRD